MPGNSFYKAKGLVQLIVYVSPQVRSKLKWMALNEERTVQKVLQRIVYKATGVKR